MRVAVDDDHPLAAPCGRQRMGKTDDAGADNRDVKAAADRGIWPEDKDMFGGFITDGSSATGET